MNRSRQRRPRRAPPHARFKPVTSHGRHAPIGCMRQSAADRQAATKSQIKAAKVPSLPGQRVNAESRRLDGRTAQDDAVKVIGG